MKETAKLSFSLGAICTVAAVLLAVGNETTADARLRAQTREKMQALSRVLPAFANAPLEDIVVADGVTFYRARDASGAITAVAGEGTTPKGFGGELRVLVGLDSGGGIRTVVVTAHKETPGLGTLATERKRQKTIADLFRRASEGEAAVVETLPPNAYLDQFGPAARAVYKRADEAPFSLRQDGGRMDGISGATVTSRAVVEAVNAVANAFRTQQAAILSGDDRS